jgi:hypothetical protein
MAGSVLSWNDLPIAQGRLGVLPLILAVPLD